MLLHPILMTSLINGKRNLLVRKQGWKKKKKVFDEGRGTVLLLSKQEAPRPRENTLTFSSPCLISDIIYEIKTPW